MLFQQTNRNKKGLRAGIANADDPSGELFAKAVKNPVLYGMKKGGLRAHDIKLTTPAARTQPRLATTNTTSSATCRAASMSTTR